MVMKSNRRHLCEMLAAALVRAPQDVSSIELRVASVLGRRYRWIAGLVQRFVKMYPIGRLRPRRKEVVDWLLFDSEFVRAYKRQMLRVADAELGSDGMSPISAAARWQDPRPITSLGELADWLCLQSGELDWFVDQKRLNGRSSTEQLWHYRSRVLPKRTGVVRLIEAPKQRLKAIQLKILRSILDHCSPHAAAHGFRQQHSIATFAEPHVSRAVVISIDLMDFFPSIRMPWVSTIFRAMGYPESVSDALAGLCVTAMPRQVWDRYIPQFSSPRNREQWHRYAEPHLPQGAPTSPALANLAAFRLDCRLSGLSASAGVNYTRYADDLVFSGDDVLMRRSRQFAMHVAAIVQEEGFIVNHYKTRIMRSGRQQRVAGVVVNECLNGRRVDFDRLKATLTNCARQGPESQNRQHHPEFRKHLLGKIAHWKLLNPNRGRKLKDIFDQIDWEYDSPNFLEP